MSHIRSKQSTAESVLAEQAQTKPFTKVLKRSFSCFLVFKLVLELKSDRNLDISGKSSLLIPGYAAKKSIIGKYCRAQEGWGALAQTVGSAKPQSCHSFFRASNHAFCTSNRLSKSASVILLASSVIGNTLTCS